MSKKLVSTICILAILNYIGCSSKEVMTKNTFIRIYNLSNGDNSKDIYVNTITDDQYFFQSGNYLFEADSLLGNGKKILPTKEENFKGKIALTDILTVEQETVDTGNTILLVLGILVTGALIYVALAAATITSITHDVTH
jgi:hypothetical protein